MKPSENTILGMLKGRELSAVTFVRDYLQLQFDGPFLNVFVWPKIKNDGTTFTFGSLAYRDALCGQIGKTIGGAVEEADKQLSFFFTDGSLMEISLLPQDRLGPEAVLFQDGTGNFGVW